MYPVKLGFDEAINRIKKLRSNGHHAESLVTSVFTGEKMLRRTLKQIIISAGFKNKNADDLIKRMGGLEAIKNNWKIYEPSGKSISEIIGNDNWKLLKEAATMRNKLIHGERVYNLEKCKTKTNQLLECLKIIKEQLDHHYSYSGWDRVSVRRKSYLHKDPKITLKAK